MSRKDAQQLLPGQRINGQQPTIIASSKYCIPTINYLVIYREK